MHKVIFICLLITIFSLKTSASDFGCKVILCLAAPTHPVECAGTLKKLYRRLRKGKGFPSCDFSAGDTQSIKTNEGYDPYYPCKEGYTMHKVTETKEVGKDDDHDVTITKAYCRKFLGYKEKWDHDEKEKVKVPVYSQYKALKRDEPYWVQISVNGDPKGQKFWYQKKR